MQTDPCNLIRFKGEWVWNNNALLDRSNALCSIFCIKQRPFMSATADSN